MPSNLNRISEIDYQLQLLPSGKISYKTINGIAQPYLQWVENGKPKSRFIKQVERETVFLEIETRDNLLREKELLTTYSTHIAQILLNNPYMAGTPGIGIQSFNDIIEHNCVYVDKTDFISDWWHSNDTVTLITRPRRFGKTLMLSTVEAFFASKKSNIKEAFKRLKIHKDIDLAKLQGTFPVILVTFAGVKSRSYNDALLSISHYIAQIFSQFDYLVNSTILSKQDKERFTKAYNGVINCNEHELIFSINTLSELLSKHHSSKVIILIDEYDTPLHEGYLNGYWDEITTFMRNFFNAALKTNPFLERALLTGITRIAQNSLFSDFNNLAVYSVTSPKYATSFGFTQDEVFDLIDCFEDTQKNAIKQMYDGFTIGGYTDIYNPWSIINYLQQRQLLPYWANSGGHELLSSILRQCNSNIKNKFEILLSGNSVPVTFEENISFYDLSNNENSIWSLLLASGYLRADKVSVMSNVNCYLTVTNKETLLLLKNIVHDWFNPVRKEYNEFCRALLSHNVEDMTEALSYILKSMVSYFDVPKNSSSDTLAHSAENFYHGLILGLIVDLKDQYNILSNRESGLGRYDISLIPIDINSDAMIIEFKIFSPKKDNSLFDAAHRALQQITDKKYATDLIARGINKDKIHMYGIAFERKEVEIAEW